MKQKINSGHKIDLTTIILLVAAALAAVYTLNYNINAIIDLAAIVLITALNAVAKHFTPKELAKTLEPSYSIIQNLMSILAACGACICVTMGIVFSLGIDAVLFALMRIIVVSMPLSLPILIFTASKTIGRNTKKRRLHRQSMPDRRFFFKNESMPPSSKITGIREFYSATTQRSSFAANASHCGNSKIINAITPAVLYILTCNIAEFLLLITCLLCGWTLNLTCAHFILINIVVILPAFGLVCTAFKHPQEAIFLHHEIFLAKTMAAVCLCGFLGAVFAVLAYAIGMFASISPLFYASDKIGSGMAYIVLAAGQIINVYNFKGRSWLFNAKSFNSKTLNISIAAAFLLMILCIQALGEFASMLHWICIVLLCAGTPLICTLIKKLLFAKPK